MSEETSIERVLVTGGTGFVGRQVVRELIARGITPVCLVRSSEKLARQLSEVTAPYEAVVGELDDKQLLADAAKTCQAGIHLVGIIVARRLQGQTFHKVHVEGTQNVVHALQTAGVKRYLHMSALGSRSDGISLYHQTKWQAEELVRKSGLDWTLFRPSLIHGPTGEFMQLMKRFICGLVPPVIPYFGSGEAKLQPVSVKDVAYCIVESLERPETFGQAYELGGPKAYSWVELYNACRAIMPGAKHWKPLVSQPVPVAKVMAVLSVPALAMAEIAIPKLGLFRFDSGQVIMSQEDNVCDHTVAEKAFEVTMRDFEEELTVYAERIP